MEVLTAIKKRRSVRSFQPKQVPKDLLDTCLEAGAYAPYAQEDSRHFTVVQNPEVLEKINASAKRTAVGFGIPGLAELGNDTEFNCFWNAPTVLIISGSDVTASPEVDCSAAAQNILLAAEALGLGSCWVFFPLLAFKGADAEELATAIGLPDDFAPHVAIALGYKNEEATEVSDRALQFNFVE